MVCLTVWLEMPCALPASVGGSQPAVRQAGLFVLVSEAYLAAPPTQKSYACIGAEATHGLALRAPPMIMPRVGRSDKQRRG